MAGKLVSVDEVLFRVIASDPPSAEKRGNLILHAAQRIEIATPTFGGFAITDLGVFQQARSFGFQ